MEEKIKLGLRQAILTSSSLQKQLEDSKKKILQLQQLQAELTLKIKEQEGVKMALSSLFLTGDREGISLQEAWTENYGNLRTDPDESED